MKLDNFEQLEQLVSEAAYVLVGIGEEWVVTWENILDDLALKEKDLYDFYRFVESEKRYESLRPFLKAYYFEKYIPDEWKNAYENLRKLLEGKNYFIVSLTLDSYLARCGMLGDKCVNPCGSYERMQCGNGCDETLISAEEMMKKIATLFDCQGQKKEDIAEQMIDIVKAYRCESCGTEICFNVLDVPTYREEGYLESWQAYMKWLQGTLNRKLCVLELGAGVKLPSVIRWPFEKTVFYNQKSCMVRVHDKLYQVNEEIAERMYSYQSDSVKFFSNKNVEAF